MVALKRKFKKRTVVHAWEEHNYSFSVPGLDGAVEQSYKDLVWYFQNRGICKQVVHG